MAIPVPNPFDPAAVAAAAVDAANTVANNASKIPGVDQLGDVADGARAVRAWISDRHNWTRVAWFGAGVVMFTVGAVMVGERPLANATASVARPVGNVVKSVKG